MNSSILSFPERGPFGNATYPGNCSGYVLTRLIQQFRPRFVVDPMEGSGTSRDVCARLKIPFMGFDLRSGFDAVSTPLISVLPNSPDLIFLHPPYHLVIVYSGNVWGEKPVAGDLSRCLSLADYRRKLHRVIAHCDEALAAGGHLAVLIGDMRQQGYYTALLPVVLDALPPHRLESILIKVQHHVSSDRTAYNGSFIPIRHEYLVLFRKDSLPPALMP